MKTVKDIMSTSFHTLSPDMPVSEAVKMFKSASLEERRTIFGMMVMDERQALVGILSMYDILLALQPKHIHIWGEMKDIDLDGLVNSACQRSRSVLVGDIMSTDIVTVPVDAHLFMVLEIMNKKHIRRLPVLEQYKVVGMVYISDLFHHLLERLHETA
jgi:CBS-domain-containing membrane protein